LNHVVTAHDEGWSAAKKEPSMTPPTIQEIAGISMLALVAAGLIAYPAMGSHTAPAQMTATAPSYANVIPIDGIEDFALPVRGDVAKPVLLEKSK
jgi:hypothetical protein